jgi:hypothetical protein
MGVKLQNRPISEEVAAYCLMAFGAGCALFLLAQPRAVVPVDLPGVVLPAAAVRAQLQADAAAARRAPRAEAAETLARLVAEHGQAETKVVEDMDTYRKRRALLGAAHAAVLKAFGAAGVDALRASAAERLDLALAMRLPESELAGVMGAFPELLSHNGAVRDGTELAPPFVLRTLYKARWNLVCGQAPISGFTPVERLAYFGWMGLQSNRLSAREQLSALERYRAEGGANARLALAILWLRGGQFEDAVKELSVLQREAPTLRLRNFLESARLSAGQSAVR